MGLSPVQNPTMHPSTESELLAAAATIDSQVAFDAFFNAATMQDPGFPTAWAAYKASHTTPVLLQNRTGQPGANLVYSPGQLTQAQIVAINSGQISGAAAVASTIIPQKVVTYPPPSSGASGNLPSATTGVPQGASWYTGADHTTIGANTGVTVGGAPSQSPDPAQRTAPGTSVVPARPGGPGSAGSTGPVLYDPGMSAGGPGLGGLFSGNKIWIIAAAVVAWFLWEDR